MATLDYAGSQVRSVGLVARRTERALFVAALAVTDLGALSLAFLLAYLLRFEFGLDIFQATTPPGFMLALAGVVIPLGIIIFYAFRLYNLHYLLGGTQEYARVLNATTLGIMLVILGLFLLHANFPRGWVLLFWMFSNAFVGVARFALRRVGYWLRGRGYLRTPTVIVGADDEGCAIAHQLMEAQTCGAEVLGFLDDTHPVGDKVAGLPVLGPVEQVQQVVANHSVEEVLLSTAALTRAQVIHIYECFGTSSSVELRLSPGLFEILTTGARVKEWGYVPLVSINKVRLDEFETAVKTVLDYTLTTVGLIVLSPILLFLAIAVKCDSPGSVLHRRRVLGRGGREFDAFKFRTMYMNGDEILACRPELVAELKANQKLKEDPRVTRLGRILRRYSLDELPQLFNVLLGQMSLVGPRMISPDEAPKYGKWKLNLLTVKPGITGMWQISGRSDVSYDERVRLDMYYIRNYSFWLDLFILFRTLPAVLAGRGAY